MLFRSSLLRERLVALGALCDRLAVLEQDYALAQQLFSEAHALLVAQDNSLFSLYRFVHRKISSRVSRPQWFSSGCHLEYWLEQDASRRLRAFMLWMEKHVLAHAA